MLSHEKKLRSKRLASNDVEKLWRTTWDARCRQRHSQPNNRSAKQTRKKRKKKLGGIWGHSTSYESSFTLLFFPKQRFYFTPHKSSISHDIKSQFMLYLEQLVLVSKSSWSELLYQNPFIFRNLSCPKLPTMKLVSISIIFTLLELANAEGESSSIVADATSSLRKVSSSNLRTEQQQQRQ